MVLSAIKLGLDGLGHGKMSSAIRLGICRILSRGCQLHRKCADLRTVAGLPRKLRVDGYPFWPTLPRLRLSTSHQHWWSLEVSISPCMVSGKGVGSGTDFNWHGMKDGYGMLWLLCHSRLVWFWHVCELQGSGQLRELCYSSELSMFCTLQCV